jgi:peptidoglycan/LPS O-acetylase OafA/YrhL
MIGSFRLFLAASVVLSHLAGSTYLEHIGYYSVRSFFILSSYAMTAALHERYRFDAKSFWLNRFLRLGPTYLATCLLTFLAVLVFPLQSASFMPRWGFPATFADIVENLLVVPVVFLRSTQFIFIEPAWSLSVEIIMYGVLFLLVARSPAFAFYGFALGFYLHLDATLSARSFEQIYFSVSGPILSFSMGALAYFWGRQNAWRIPPFATILVLGLWMTNFLAEGVLAPAKYSIGAGFYFNILFSIPVVIALSQIKTGPALARIDRMLGDLSYPIYLVQWLGAFVGYMLFMSRAPRGWELFFASVAPILLIAGALAWLQSRFVEPLRSKIRPDRAEAWAGAMQPAEEKHEVTATVGFACAIARPLLRQHVGGCQERRWPLSTAIIWPATLRSSEDLAPPRPRSNSLGHMLVKPSTWSAATSAASATAPPPSFGSDI